MTFNASLSRRLVVAAVAASSSFISFAASQPSPAARPFAQAPQIQESARLQIMDLKKIKASRTAMQKKIGSRLYLGMLEQKAVKQRVADSRLARLTAFRFLKPEADGRVPVQVVVKKSSGVPAVRKTLEALGAVIQSSKALSYESRIITARVRLEDLESLASLAQVRQVRQPLPAIMSAVNVSEGAATHGADLARAYYGSDGTGVKVCAISDGVAPLFSSIAELQRTGDLPPDVDVLPGQQGVGSEGLAMLEVIHDVAPGAKLGFATAGFDEPQMIQNIHALADAGCNIIVDDVTWGDESPFEDGPIAQAVNDVTARGILYFSAAGNEGNVADGTSSTWEGDYHESALAPPGPLDDTHLNDFGDGSNFITAEKVAPPDPFVGGPGHSPVVLIWAEHYGLESGSASTDFDLYMMDSTMSRVFDAGTDSQDPTDPDALNIPMETVNIFEGERLFIDKYSEGGTSSVPMLNLRVIGGELDDNLATHGATRGHSAAADAFSVAATPATVGAKPGDPVGPFPGLFTAANVSETTTSDGPRRILLDGVTGNELTPGNRTSTGGVVRSKPDFTAADGVATRAPDFEKFFGTSASAAHAAGIAALVKSAVPGITTAQMRTALTSTAIDIEAPGVDDATGAGIIMAQAAIAAAGGTPHAALTLAKPIFVQVYGDGDSFIEPNEEWHVTVPLQNTGGIDATSISGVLSTATPGVTIVNAKATYADLPPTVSARNGKKFDFIVGSDFPCATPIDFVLTTSYIGGMSSPLVTPITARTGGIGAPVTSSYAGPSIPIPDGLDRTGNAPGAPVEVELPVALPNNVADVNFRFDGRKCDPDFEATTNGLNHTWIGDLVVKLISPSGTPVTIVNHAGGPNNPGDSFCHTVLDDEGGGRPIAYVTKADEPNTGTFTPSEPLSTFRGEPATGTWRMQTQDYAVEDTGDIRAVSVIVRPAICDAPPAPAPRISVGDASLSEGTLGTTSRKKFKFIVKLDRASTADVTVDYATVAGTAGAKDFVAKSGTITIPAGGRAARVLVPIRPDHHAEANETVELHLSNASGATIADDTAVGTIVNDD